jgi:uncharacterized protein
MITKLLNLFKKPVEIPEPPKRERPRGIFSTDEQYENLAFKFESLIENNFKPVKNFVAKIHTMDETGERMAMDNQPNIKANFFGTNILPTQQVLWYASQTFIGYQLCAILSQHWLISKACLMPAKDATRNGYEITVNDGTEISPEVLDAIRDADVRYKLNKNLIEFVQMGRVFGIRIAMFIVEYDDDNAYALPFNPDGVRPGSYKGISQIDPYWITPQLDNEAAGNPASINFYEPTWWIINGKPVHRTHLIIYRTEEVADILKPTYIFGGVPIPQKISERVYAAERTANEAPLLALTKRTDVINIDLAQAEAEPEKFTRRMLKWVERRDNYGVKTLDLEDKMQQFDTSLTDLDAVIMTQYQIVAAASNVPAVKLMGTSPKGFNTTGEFEEASYHEELESIQCHDLSPLIQRHHLLLIRSEIAPEFNIEPFYTTVKWNELDAMTAKEQAELNKYKAETGVMLVNSGAIDGLDERTRISSDPHSGYTGLPIESLKEDEEIDLGEPILSEELSSNIGA